MQAWKPARAVAETQAWDGGGLNEGGSVEKAGQNQEILRQ